MYPDVNDGENLDDGALRVVVRKLPHLVQTAPANLHNSLNISMQQGSKWGKAERIASMDVGEGGCMLVNSCFSCCRAT